MSIHTKKVLYISLMKSTLTYCSPLWRPQYLKDIENVQRRVTKFILRDYASSYKSHLLTLHLLPLMMQFEINDILFFITSIKNPTKCFNILHYVTFSRASTRSSSKCKLVHNLSRTNRDRHFYFSRLPHLWNSLPTIDKPIYECKLKHFFWSHFQVHFDSENPCSFHFVCPCRRCAALPVTSNFHDIAL